MELKEAVIKQLNAGQKLKIHDCSLCGYPCGFEAHDNKLYYDSGCDCVSYNNVSPRDWHELDFYLDPENGHISNLEKFIQTEQAV